MVGVPSQIAQITSEIHYIDSDESDQQTKRVPGCKVETSWNISFRRVLQKESENVRANCGKLPHRVLLSSRSPQLKRSLPIQLKANIAPQAEIVELDTDMNTSKSSTDFDEDREALAYGEGPKVSEEAPDINRPPKPKLIGDQPRRNRHSIESEVETIPVDPEFIIEEPKKKETTST